MADSLTNFLIEKSTVPPGNADNWGPIIENAYGLGPGVYPPGIRQANDSTGAPVKYRITEVTANGVTVPYNMPSLNSQPVQGTVNWIRQMRTVGFLVFPTVIKVTPNGIFVTGSFKGTANFGTPGVPNSQPSSPLVSAGDNDLFLVKYDSNGAHQWSIRYGSTGSEMPVTMDIDPSGNFYIAGSFVGSANFGGSTYTSNGGNNAAFIVKYNSSGAHQWSWAFKNINNCGFTAIKVNSQGIVICASTVATGPTNPINFGTPGHPGTDLTSAFNHTNPALAAFDSGGNYQWSELIDTNNSGEAIGLSLDSQDRIYLTGHWKGGGFFFGSILMHNFTTGGQYQSVYLARIGPNGELPPFSGTWAVSYGDINAQKNFCSGLDSSGRLIAAGSFYFTANVGGGAVHGTAASFDTWVAAYSPTDGSYLGVSNFALGSDSCTPAGMAIDSQNNTYLVGSFDFTENFGGTILTAHDNGKNIDGFVWKLTPALATAWVKNWGQNPDPQTGLVLPVFATAIAIINQNPLAAGYFGYTVSFPPDLTATTPGGNDGFVMNLLP